MDSSTTNLIELAITATGLLISLIAIWQSRVSIGLTRESIQEANRPVVVVYLDYTYTVSSLKEYLVIKNYGKTAATIDLIEISPDIKILKDSSIFSQSIPFILAPNQVFSTILRTNALGLDNEKIYNGKISYHDSIKTYENTFKLNQNLVKDMKFSLTKPSKNKSVQQILSATSEEMIRRKF